MSAASTVVSYLTALALKQAQHLDRLNTDESNRQMFAAMTDLQNTVAARSQVDQVLRRLQEDVAGGEVERRTQARLQLAVEDLLERDPEFGRGVTDALNRLRALDIQRSVPMLRDAARQLRGHPGLSGAIRTHRGYAALSSPLALAAAGGACAVVIVGGVIVIDRGNETDPAPTGPNVSEPERRPAVLQESEATVFGPPVTIETSDGFRYEVQASALSWQTETSAGLAPPGQAYPVITVRTTNLLEDRAAPDPLIADSANAGLLFPETSESPTGKDCPAGLPVIDIAARGRPVSRCFGPVVLDTTRTSVTLTSDDAAAVALEPLTSREVVFTFATALPTSRRLSDLQFWSEPSGAVEFTRIPAP